MAKKTSKVDYKPGGHVRVKLSGGRIVEGEIKAIHEMTDGIRLQVSFGSETAMVREWQVIKD